MKKLSLTINKIISIFLVIILSIVSVGCDDKTLIANNYDLSQLIAKNYDLSQEKSYLQEELTYTEKQLKLLRESQVKRLFELAELHNSIKAYEIFLLDSANFDDLRNKAIHHIYQLTEKADLIVGYQYFLQHYSQNYEAKQANYRLYEIAYQIAEKVNTIPEYIAFLSNFEAAPKDLREKALDKGVALECQSLLTEFQKTIESKGIDEIYRDFIVDRIGKRLYEQALDANDKGDKVGFLQKYNTILKCNLFKVSNTRFALLRDAEIKKMLQNIEYELITIREDINKSNNLILQKLTNIQDVGNQQSAYIKEIVNIINCQSKVLDKIQNPLMWDDNETVWQNFMRIGEPALQIALTSAEALKYVKTLRQMVNF
ncbi:hypothetical protein [Nostoc sp.]|uniref:hypothetical protein n=1 Tax=Nostoc sp. TaxID=1180 RepID=UPI002FFA2F6D